MNNEKDYISKLTNLIPLLSLAFIVYSAIVIFFYYKFFNFNILPFLEVTEFLPLTLFEFIINCVFIVVFYVILLFFKRFPSFYIIAISLIILSLAGLIGYDIYNKNYHSIVNADLYFVFGFVSTLIIIYLKKIFEKLKIPVLDFNNQFLICVFFLIGINSAFRAYSKYYDVKNNHLFEGSYILFNNVKIPSTPNHYYIGKCKNYYLYYDNGTNSVDLYSVTAVTKANIASK
jgi:hypothetical protein